MITKETCKNEFMQALMKRSMLELTSGGGQDFCDAMAEAIYNIVSKMDIVFTAHTHECSAPGAPSATPLPSSLFLDPEA